MKIKLPLAHPFARRVYEACNADPAGRLLLTLHSFGPDTHTRHRTFEITKWDTRKDSMTMTLVDPLEEQDWTLEKMLGGS